MRERRRLVRIPDDSQVSYRILPEARTERFIAQDISSRGMRFFVHEFIPVGRSLKIQINFEAKMFIFETNVRVIWCREDSHNQRYEVGVEFVDTPRERIRRLIALLDNR